MTDEIPIADAITAVRQTISLYPYRSPTSRLNGLRAALDYLSDYERVVAERDNAIDGRNDYCAQYKREQVTAFQYLKERDAARAELATARQTIADLGESVGKLDVALAEARAEIGRLQQSKRLKLGPIVERTPFVVDREPEDAPPPEDAMEAPPFADGAQSEAVAGAPTRKCADTTAGALSSISEDAMEAARQVVKDWRDNGVGWDNGLPYLEQVIARALTAERQRYEKVVEAARAVAEAYSVVPYHLQEMAKTALGKLK